MLTIILAFIALLHIPFGTALGIYTLWVLLPAGADAEYTDQVRQSISKPNTGSERFAATERGLPERLDPGTVRRYLGVLGVAWREPDLAALSELVEAHLVRVPFENISKLYYRKNLGLSGLPSIERFLDGIEKYHFGGTCYSNNFHFYSLLASLGYAVKLCAADMATPDVHMVSMVTVEGQEYLVDTGYAAPLLSPLPRDLTTDYVVALGRDRYLLKPQDPTGCSRLELHRNGTLKHGYLAKPEPRGLKDFGRVIADSFAQPVPLF